ncbi:MAG TPA: 5'-nucleotidase, lipoprotein e(P4) family [Crocinitomicaceae bacterium]|nr:5'-nucleotidase, lipoprotein e(P4) family [Crocinitomicaceae bacterium]
MKNNIFKVAFLSLLITLIGCSTVKQTEIPSREYTIQSVLWQQNAAEYRALCYQAFNLAKIQLDLELKNLAHQGRQVAIITDIDETVLDNSPYNAKLILDDAEYTKEEWINWGNQITALAVPGAVDFLNYAKSKNVEVFYVSNRFKEQHETTLANLQKLNFPYADDRHLLLMTDESSKQKRFDEVAKNCNVVLFLGDNLTDFGSEFSLYSTEQRNALTDKNHAKFGVKYIVLPNPMYGDWEMKGIFQGKHALTKAQRRAILRASLRTY